jgi:hypothetical protein
MSLQPQEIDLLVGISDPDGAWALMEEIGDYDAQQYIEEKYFGEE